MTNPLSNTLTTTLFGLSSALICAGCYLFSYRKVKESINMAVKESSNELYKTTDKAISELADQVKELIKQIEKQKSSSTTQDEWTNKQLMTLATQVSLMSDKLRSHETSNLKSLTALSDRQRTSQEETKGLFDKCTYAVDSLAKPLLTLQTVLAEVGNQVEEQKVDLATVSDNTKEVMVSIYKRIDLLQQELTNIVKMMQQNHLMSNGNSSAEHGSGDEEEFHVLKRTSGLNLPHGKGASDLEEKATACPTELSETTDALDAMNNVNTSVVDLNQSSVNNHPVVLAANCANEA
jgi:hypothetical protein